jgi:tetratricopeptide (TPR) repeat protein
MEPSKTSKVRDLIAEAIRRRDAATVIRLVTELVDSTEGAEKAYWLRYRASAKQDFGRGGNPEAIEADWAEAMRAWPEDVATPVYAALNRAMSEQQMSHLKEIPRHLRHAAYQRLNGEWVFWSNIGYLRWLRGRFYQSYRAYTRTVYLYRNLPAEKRKNNGGWAVPIYCWHGRAALRLGRLEEAVADVAQATAVDQERERKHLHPIFLAVARAELAFAEGRFQAAIEEIQIGRSRSTAGAFGLPPVSQIECDLIAARVARAEGNPVGFQHFCERALQVAVDQKLAFSEAEVKAVLNGALW